MGVHSLSITAPMMISLRWIGAASERPRHGRAGDRDLRSAHHFWYFCSERIAYQRYLLHGIGRRHPCRHNVHSTVFIAQYFYWRRLWVASDRPVMASRMCCRRRDGPRQVVGTETIIVATSSVIRSGRIIACSRILAGRHRHSGRCGRSSSGFPSPWVRLAWLAGLATSDPAGTARNRHPIPSVSF